MYLFLCYFEEKKLPQQIIEPELYTNSGRCWVLLFSEYSLLTTKSQWVLQKEESEQGIILPTWTMITLLSGTKVKPFIQMRPNMRLCCWLVGGCVKIFITLNQWYLLKYFNMIAFQPILMRVPSLEKQWSWALLSVCLSSSSSYLLGQKSRKYFRYCQIYRQTLDM